MTAVEHVLGWKGSAEPTTPRRGDTGGHPVGVALNRGWVDVDAVVRTGWDDRLGNTRGPSDQRADWLLGRLTTASSRTSNDGPPGMPGEANARWALTPDLGTGNFHPGLGTR